MVKDPVIQRLCDQYCLRTRLDLRRSLLSLCDPVRDDRVRSAQQKPSLGRFVVHRPHENLLPVPVGAPDLRRRRGFLFQSQVITAELRRLSV